MQPRSSSSHRPRNWSTAPPRRAGLLALALACWLATGCAQRVQPPDWIVTGPLSAVDGSQAAVPALPGFTGGCFWPFVNLYTGELFASYRAVAVPSVGWPWDLRLYYNSALVSENSAFGLGWRHSYDIRLDIAPGFSTIEVIWGDGRHDLFTQNGSAWDADPALQGRRITATGGGYELRTKNGIVYHFDTAGRLSALVDRNANTMSFAYDGSGRLITIADATGRTLSFSYDAQNHVTQVAGLITQPLQFAYTGNLLADVVDPAGFPYHYQYDGLNRLIRATDGAARDIDLVYYSSPFSQVVAQASGSGELRRFDYDGASRQTTVRDRISPVETRAAHYRFDAKGLCVEVQDENLGLALSAYDPATNTILSHTDGDGRTTSYTYDALCNLLTGSYADGSQLAFTYDPTYNLPLSYQRRSGGITSYAYDPNGNLLTSTNPLGGQVVLSYTPRGEVATAQDERGFVTQYQYDVFGNMIRMTNPAGDVREAAYDAEGEVVSVTDRFGTVWPIGRNARHEATTLTEPTGGVHQFSYTPSGRLASRQDPMGSLTNYSYDGLDRLVRAQLPGGGTHDFTRDGAGRVTEEIDPLGQILRYTRDGVGRVVQRVHPGGQVWQYNWGACDLQSAVDALGILTTYQYDAVHRLIQSTSPGVSRFFGYDLGSRLVIARLSSPPDPDVIHTYAYDAMDRRIGGTQQPLNRNVSWTRNPHGDVQSANDNLRPGSATWSYDTRERTSAVGTTGPVFSASIAYDKEERVTQLSYTNGVLATYAYDASGRMRSMRDQSPSFLATYDPIVRNPRGDAINVNVSTPALAPTNFSLAYDANRNIVNEMLAGVSRNYAYDPANNRIFKNGPAGPEPYVLAPNSWLLSAGAYNQIWNANGQVTHSARPGQNVDYVYRSDRRLDQVIVNGQVFDVHMGPLDEIAKLRLPAGTESWYGYDFAGGGVLRRSVHTAVGIAPTEEFVYVHDDLADRGSVYAPVLSLKAPFVAANRRAVLVGPSGVSRVTDGNGVIVGAKDFTAFGEVAGQIGAASLPSFDGMDHTPGFDALLRVLPTFTFSTDGGEAVLPPVDAYYPTVGSYLSDRSFGPDICPDDYSCRSLELGSDRIENTCFPLSSYISPQELNFQTDGPIICQALFQRLAPRAPQYGAQINYAGDRLEVYFDPAYTVTQGGIIFGTTSPMPGGSGTILLPQEPQPSGSPTEPSPLPVPDLPYWGGSGTGIFPSFQEWLNRNAY